MRLVIAALSFTLLLTSCGSPKEVAPIEPPAPRPSWVSSKPINSGMYSGIGMAYKSAGADYIAMAKNNALNDLASEISVNISSSSLFYQIEQDDNLLLEIRSMHLVFVYLHYVSSNLGVRILLLFPLSHNCLLRRA